MPHFLIRNTVLSDRRLPLPGKVVVIGRSLDADVPLQHKSVSRRHALLEATESGYVISDLGSSNGTFIDGLRVYPAEKASLPLGQNFRLGEVRIILSPDEIIGGDDPVTTAVSGPALRRDGSLTLAPAPTPHTAPSRRSAMGASAAGKKPRPALKARMEQRRAKREATRWAMVALTVVLVSLAAFFAYRIAQNRTRGPLLVPEEGSGGDAVPEEVKPPERKPEVAPIIIDKNR